MMKRRNTLQAMDMKSKDGSSKMGRREFFTTTAGPANSSPVRGGAANSTNDSAVSAARDLSAQLDPGRVLMPGPSYDEARRIWNGAVEHRPALIVRCETPAEVQAAVGAARHHHLLRSGDSSRQHPTRPTQIAGHFLNTMRRRR